MANSICLRCLVRPLTELYPHTARLSGRNVATTAAFSTTSTLSAQPVKKKGAVVMKKGGTSFNRVKGNAPGARSGRTAAPGERKAMRKRVVLSNTNALEVPGLENLSAHNMLDEARRGQVMGLADDTVDSLRALGAFKPTQGWKLFRRPATLVTSHTQQIAQDIQSITQNKSTSRQVITGERGSGKSVLQLQTLAMASLSGWIVIHLPEAQDLTIANTSYAPITTPSDQILYTQPEYTATLLSNIAKANHALLSKLTLSKTDHNLPMPIQSNISLSRLADLGASDPTIAWPIFTALWTEITAPARPPIAYSLDSVAHIMGLTNYLATDATKIHAHDLALVEHFTSHLSGQKTLPNGGIVIAADSGSNRPSVPVLDHVFEKRVAEQKGRKPPVWNPYVRADERVLDVLSGVQVREVGGLSKGECKGIMEYYARSGLLRGAVDARGVGERWTLSGGGVVGEVERGSVVMRI